MWNAIFSAVLAFLGSLFKKSDGEKLGALKEKARQAQARMEKANYPATDEELDRTLREGKL